MSYGLLAAIAAATMAAAAPTQTPQSVSDWREDVAVARTEFLEKDKSFSPEHRAQAAARLDRLSQALPDLTDTQIEGELARVAALADNAHTRAYLLRNRGLWRRYPIHIWRFADGWRVIAARPGYEALLGGRIVSIGGTPVAAAAAKVRPLFAGVDNWADYMSTYSLTSADALLASDVIQGSGDAVFEVETVKGRVKLPLPAGPPQSRQVPEESWWFLSPAHEASQGWVHVLGGQKLPAYLSQPNAWYSLRRCAGGVLYVQFNRAEDQEGRGTIAELGQDVLAAVRADPAARLVFDVRLNTGGNLQKAQPFVDALATSEVGRTRGRLYVVVGPNTFSAGTTPVAALRQDSRAVLVGTEPGDRLNYWSEGGNVTLPHSKINLHYGDRAHLYGLDAPPTPADLVYLRYRVRDLKPDLPADLSFADYVAGRDPSAEKVVPGGLVCPN